MKTSSILKILFVLVFFLFNQNIGLSINSELNDQLYSDKSSEKVAELRNLSGGTNKTEIKLHKDFSKLDLDLREKLFDLDDPNRNWTLQTTEPGTNHTVRAFFVDGDYLYVGGVFTSAGGINASRIARYNMNTGEWFALGEGIDGPGSPRVDAIAVHNNNVYVGGSFDSAGDVNTDNIARFDLEENRWYSMDGGVTRENVSSSVSALIMHGDDLYVGGDFTEAGGVNSTHIARFQTVNKTWHSISESITGRIYAFALTGNDLYVGGIFGHAEDSNIEYIAKYDILDENWHSFNVGISGSVETLTIDGDNLYMAGNFIMNYPVATRGIVRYDITHQHWRSLDNGINGTVHSIEAFNEHIYIAGDLKGSIDYGGSGYIARYNKNFDNWDELGWDTNGIIRAIARAEEELYLGGSFGLIDEVPALNIANYSISDDKVNSLGNGLGGWVYATAMYKDNLYIGGDFNGAGGIKSKNLIRYNITSDSWHPVDFELDHPVTALEVYGDDLYIGGWFSNVGSQNIIGIVRYNLNNKSLHSLGNGFDSLVETILIHGEDLYVGSAFDAEVFRYNIPSENWHPLGDGIEGEAIHQDDLRVYDLAILGSKIFVGGFFDRVEGVEVSNIAYYNTETENWYSLGDGVDNYVYTLAVHNNDLFIGGSFTNAGDLSVNHIVRFNVETENWYTLGTGLNDIVRETEVIGDNLFVGGFFNSNGGDEINKENLNHIAYYDIEMGEWHSMGDGIDSPLLNTRVASFTRNGRDLYMGGSFISAGGKPASRIARWTIPSNIDIPVESGQNPTIVYLQQNYPNPFNPQTQITFGLSQSANVRVDVFNITGQHIATLVNEFRSTGTHTVSFDASAFASGIYICRVVAESSFETVKMLLVK